MENFQTNVFAILFNGVPYLVSPIGTEPASTYLIDMEEVFVLLEQHADSHGVVFWTEYGKGITALSNNLGKVIEEKISNAWEIQ